METSPVDVSDVIDDLYFEKRICDPLWWALRQAMQAVEDRVVSEITEKVAVMDEASLRSMARASVKVASRKVAQRIAREG